MTPNAEVFVSYAWVDNEGDGWVSALCDDLQLETDRLVGRSGRISYFFDSERIRGNELVSREIDEAVAASGAMVTIASPGYWSSPYCQRELDIFGGRPGYVPESVFPVWIGAPDEMRRGLLSDRTGYVLCETDQPSVRRSLSDPATKRIIIQLAADIVQFARKAEAPTPGDTIPDQLRDPLLKAFGASALTSLADRNEFVDSILRDVSLPIAQCVRSATTDGTGAFSSKLVEAIWRYRHLRDGFSAVAVVDRLETWAHLSPQEMRQLKKRLVRFWENCPYSYRAVLTSGKAEPVADGPGGRLHKVSAVGFPELWLEPADSDLGEPVIERSFLGRNASDRDFLADDALVVNRAFHPHVRSLLGIVDRGSDSTLSAVYEFCYGESVARDRSASPVPVAANTLAQIGAAIDHLRCVGDHDVVVESSAVYLDTISNVAHLVGSGFVETNGRSQSVGSRLRPAESADDTSNLRKLARVLLLGTSHDGELAQFRDSLDQLLGGTAHIPTMQFVEQFREAALRNKTPRPERVAEHAYLSSVKQDCLTYLDSYIKMRATVDREEHRRTGPRGPVRATIRNPVARHRPASGGAGQETTDLAGEILRLRKTLVLGDPGIGKTTALLRTTLEACDRAQLDEAAPIPLFVPVGRLPDSQGPEAFVLSETSLHLGDWAELARTGRMMLIVDGLNETDDAGRDEVVRLLEKVKWFTASCRVRDYRGLLSGLEVDTLQLLDLDPARMQELIAALLPGDQSNFWSECGGCDLLIERWNKLRNNGEEDRFWDRHHVPDYTSFEEDEAWVSAIDIGVLELCKSPFLLGVVVDLYRDENRIPKSRGEAYSASVVRLFDREIGRLADVEDSTLEELGAEAVVALVLRAAVEIAVHSQTLGTGLGLDRSAAVEHIQKRNLGDASAEWILTFLLDASILVESPGGKRVTYSHHLLQEYFAGDQLLADFRSGKNPNIYSDGDSWIAPTGWEETAVLAAGLVGADSLQDYVMWICSVSPELAMRCLSEGADEPQLLRDSKYSIRLRPFATERWEAATSVSERRAAGRALSRIGDDRPGVGVLNGIPDIMWVPVEYCIPFEMSKYPVTVDEFRAFVSSIDGLVDIGRPGSHWSDHFTDEEENLPATGVTWYEAIRFSEWMSEVTGTTVRLASSPEWIHAAAQASDAEIAGINCLEHESSGISAVGTFSDRERMVCELRGGVWEWMGEPITTGAMDQDDRFAQRAVRGGSSKGPFAECELPYRALVSPTIRRDDIGFRVVRECTS